MELSKSDAFSEEEAMIIVGQQRLYDGPNYYDSMRSKLATCIKTLINALNIIQQKEKKSLDYCVFNSSGQKPTAPRSVCLLLQLESSYLIQIWQAGLSVRIAREI